MDRILRGFIVLLFGVATTALTAAGLVYLELRYDCAIYGFVYGFVLPFGAFLSGLVAASGFYLGSKLVSYRPGRGMLAVLLAVSGTNFFLIYWLKYNYTVADGQSLRELMSFRAYLDFVLTHTSLTTGTGAGDGITLGVAGYLFAVLLIAGFALGGLCIYAALRAAAYCDACSRYMKKQGSQTRYFVQREEMTACRAEMCAEMAGGHFRRAMQLHAGAGAREASDATGYQLRVGVSQCAGCGKQWLELFARERKNKAWSTMTNLGYTAYCTEPIDALEQLAGSR